jgi:hypothetical protein
VFLSYLGSLLYVLHCTVDILKSELPAAPTLPAFSKPRIENHHQHHKKDISSFSHNLLSSPYILIHLESHQTMVSPATPSKDQAEVVLVGCGCPLRGMGWYHAVQMLGDRVPHAKLCHVVEGWFLGPGASGPGGKEFADFQKQTEEEHGVAFHKSLADLPPVPEGVKRLALISGRTADNPRLLSEATMVCY